MVDEKDRYGEKIHQLEQAREDQWARESDRLLLEKLRARQSGTLHCPRCNAELRSDARDGHGGLVCPNDHGAWLEGAALERLTERVK